MHPSRHNLPRFFALLLPLALWVAHPVYHPVPHVELWDTDVDEECALCLIAACTQPVETFAPEPVPEVVPAVRLPIGRPFRQPLLRPACPATSARGPPC